METILKSLLNSFASFLYFTKDIFLFTELFSLLTQINLFKSCPYGIWIDQRGFLFLKFEDSTAFVVKKNLSLLGVRIILNGEKFDKFFRSRNKIEICIKFPAWVAARFSTAWTLHG